jgi:TrmH family RNA methyltransferase
VGFAVAKSTLSTGFVDKFVDDWKTGYWKASMERQKLSKNHLAELAALKQKKQRLRQGKVVVEGVRTLLQLKEYGIAPLEQYLAVDGEPLWDGIPCFEAGNHQWERLCDSLSPQGMAALYPLPRQEAADFKTALYLDGISDPGNLGAIFRIAAAFGLDCLLLSPDCAEVSSPKVIRSSLGSVFKVPHLVLPGEELASAGAEIHVLDTSAGVSLDKLCPLPERRTILVVGSEAHGVSAPVRRLATSSLAIPMRGGMESLNAAIAAGIAAYHLFLQRNRL